MKRFKQTLAALLIVSTTHVAFVQTAQATMIGTEQVAQASQGSTRSGAEARANLGNVFQKQRRFPEAIAAYEKAYRGLDDSLEFRRLVEVKLNALGVGVGVGIQPKSGSSGTEK